MAFTTGLRSVLPTVLPIFQPALGFLSEMPYHVAQWKPRCKLNTNKQR